MKGSSIMEAIKAPPPIAKRAPFQPQKAPMQPINLISAPPMDSSFNRESAMRAIHSKRPDPRKAPLSAVIIEEKAFNRYKSSALNPWSEGKAAESRQPRIKPPIVRRSGMSKWSRSIKLAVIKRAIKSIAMRAWEGGRRSQEERNRKPVVASMMTYLKLK